MNDPLLQVYRVLQTSFKQVVIRIVAFGAHDSREVHKVVPVICTRHDDSSGLVAFVRGARKNKEDRSTRQLESFAFKADAFVKHMQSASNIENSVS